MLQDPSSTTGDFSLDFIRALLDSFVPPSRPFDPAGAWDHAYDIHSLAALRRSDRGLRGVVSASLRMQRTPVDDGTFRLTIDHRKFVRPGLQHTMHAESVCRADVLATPMRWSTRLEIATGNSEIKGLTARTSSGVVNGSDLMLTSGKFSRRMTLSAACTTNWSMFDAVQRLPHHNGPSLDFALLEDFNQLKPNHRLEFRRTVEARVGCQWVRRQVKEELEKGTIYRTVVARTDGQPLLLHGFQQLGDSVLPLIYWTDDAGRLLFVISGLQVYVWKPAAA